MMITIYKGATFKILGTLQKDGAPSDFTGWSLTANLYDQNGSNLISALSVIFVDATLGAITISAPSTLSWAPGKARIDCKLVSPVGDIIYGPPTYIRILQTPMN